MVNHTYKRAGRNATIFAMILFTGIQSLAQISTYDTPYTFSQNCPDSIKSAPVQTGVMPHVNNDSLQLLDSINPPSEDEYRFGVALSVDIGLTNSGTWHNLQDGGRLWRTRIISKGAYFLYFIYDNFWLPPGAELFLYDEHRSMTIGAFTDANNNAYGTFVTQPVVGDTIILEYYEPANVQPGRINLSKVVHAYQNIILTQISGPCNINVACPQGDNSRNEIRSASMILKLNNNGEFAALCSGSLLNNTTEDGRPYFLTAFHCLDDIQDAVLTQQERNEVQNWLFMFNREAGRCQDVTWHQLHTISGAVFRAAFADTDFALLELSALPPAIFGVHYAGWTRSITPASSSVGIHHPRGDIKKISIGGSAVSEPNTVGWLNDNDVIYTTTPPNTHWRTIWNEGTTERGSSGSPLFDQNHRVVGQLHGGNSDCDNLLSPNFYGRFDISWIGDGTDDTRLSNWLDPDGTGVDFIDGWDPTCTNIDLIVSEVVNNGETKFHAATRTITASPSYVINSGGEATFKAGQKIIGKPGFRAEKGSKGHAFIAPVDLDCSPPLIAELRPFFDNCGGGGGQLGELFPGAPCALACFPYLLVGNVLHGKKPYQLQFIVNGAESGITVVNVVQNIIPSFIPVPNDHFTYVLVAVDANGDVAFSQTSPLITVIPTGFPCPEDAGKWDGNEGSNNETTENSSEKERDSIMVDALKWFAGITIHPNPTSGQFTLTLPTETNATVQVYDLLGNVIHTSTNNQQQSTIDITSHPKGVYFVRVVQGSNIYTEKIVVQ